MPLASLSPGHVLSDRFEIICEAGRGGSSVVYRALDLSARAPVAVKLFASMSPNPAAERRFSREAKVLGELRHPGIVRYVAHGALPDGQAFLVMEWIEGEPLSRRLQRGALEAAECVALLSRVGDALSAAHPRKIVHRDIKPSNIMLRGGAIDRAVLLDFGVARYGYDPRSITRTGALIGTPFYMSPEQARSEPDVGPAADIYSLGAVIYECLSGGPPFPGENPTAILSMIILEECAPLHEKAPGAPSELCALVDRMMSKDPAMRPGSAAALLDELSALPAWPQDEGGEPEPASSAPSDPPPITGAERVLVSVVMAAPRSRRGSSEGAPAAPTLDCQAALDRLKSFGAGAEARADGSVVGTLTRQSSSAVDIVTLGARCSLAMRELLPDACIALATGLGVRGERGLAAGGTLERAARLAQPSAGEAESSTVSAEEGVVMDDMSAGLLSGRFSQTRSARGAILTGERASFDESRLVRGSPTPFVGRDLEVSLMAERVQAAIREREARALLITGPPGVGKSRFRDEVVSRIRASVTDVKVIMGRGDPLQLGSPYGAIRRALCFYLGIHSGAAAAEQQAQITAAALRAVGPEGAARVAERLGELCGVRFSDEDSDPLRAARVDPKVLHDEICQAFLDWLRAESSAAPVLLILEDLQWGDRLTMKLMDAVVHQLHDMPIVVLATARSEVSDVFPRPWRWLSEELALHPLNKTASAELIRGVLGDDASEAVVKRIVRQSGGNPLYLEELIRAEMDGRAAEAPETLLAMLHARFSRLAFGARRVLRAASVFGEVFCCGGVQALERGHADEIEGWMSLLIDEDIVRQAVDVRLDGKGELRFYHALYREAAYQMLTEADRATGHAAASRYLESAGEPDPCVIAEHAERGGDRERALTFYLLAAKGSWEQNDVDGVLARVDSCVALGAAGEALGLARALECQAYMAKGLFEAVDRSATAAIAMLRPGCLWWCRTIEKLFIVLPHMGQLERLHELSQRFLRTEFEPDAGVAYVIAASYPLAMFPAFGDRAATAAFLARLEMAEFRSVIEREPLARGWLLICRGMYVHILEPDPFLGMVLAREGDRAFEVTGVLSNLVLSKLLRGSTESDMGNIVGGLGHLRDCLTMATRLGDSYLIANSQTYFAIALCDRTEPEYMDEAHELARSLIHADVGPAFLGGAYLALATIELARRRFSDAEESARRSLEHWKGSPSFALFTLATLIRTLLAQDRRSEACARAEEGSRILTALGGAGWSEVPFRVAAAEAWRAAGEVERARDALREALRQIAIRADKIDDPTWRETFLSGRPENVRAAALAREWLDNNGGAR